MILNKIINKSFANNYEMTTQENPYSLIIMIIFFSILCYFMVIRPQQKKIKIQKQIINSISIGDEILTKSGIIGKIIKIKKTGYVLIEINPENKIIIKKNFISAILPKGTINSIQK